MELNSLPISFESVGSALLWRTLVEIGCILVLNTSCVFGGPTSGGLTNVDDMATTGGLSSPVETSFDDQEWESYLASLSDSGTFSESYCCKVCSKGQACGNFCISRANTCRKPPGCACQR